MTTKLLHSPWRGLLAALAAVALPAALAAAVAGQAHAVSAAGMPAPMITESTPPDDFHLSAADGEVVFAHQSVTLQAGESRLIADHLPLQPGQLG